MNRLRTGPLPVVQFRDALRSDLDSLPDAELLGRFARYADHPAFEVLVRRHGPMVFGVCRRVLAGADADDAFQATFLVLIRRAKGLRGGRLGPWLYGVAYRVALRARLREARRAASRTEATDMIPDPTSPAEVPDWLPILDAELAALPAKYRDPLVLCELEGATRAAAAKALGVPEGTLSSRLARGRELLRKRLIKHGTLLPAGGLAALFGANNVGRATVPAALLAKTCELGAAPAGAVPVGAARLTDEVLRGMFLTKLGLAGGILALVALATVGLAAGAWPGEAPGEGKGGAKLMAPPAAPGGAKPADRGAPPAGQELFPVAFVDSGTVPGDHDALQGLWVLEKFDLDVKGANVAESKEVREAIGKMQMLVAGDVWWGMMGGPGGNIFPQTAVIDPKKNPKWLDWRGWDGTGGSALTRCIYELDGDRLRLCMPANGEHTFRPAEFAADADASLAVMTFRRGKLPPAAGEKLLLGSWAGEEIIRRRPEEPEQRFTPRVEILDGYLFALTDGPAGGEWIGGKYTVDATKNPKWIDVDLAFPRDGGKVPKLYGCYEAADGRLKVVLGSKRATRPLELKDEGDVLFFDLKPRKERDRPAEPAPMPKAKGAPIQANPSVPKGP